MSLKLEFHLPTIESHFSSEFFDSLFPNIFLFSFIKFLLYQKLFNVCIDNTDSIYHQRSLNHNLIMDLWFSIFIQILPIMLLIYFLVIILERFDKCTALDEMAKSKPRLTLNLFEINFCKVRVFFLSTCSCNDLI